MANRTPEQDLIDLFVKHLHVHDDHEIKIYTLINDRCKSHTYADIEYVSISGQHWVIEAKSNDSSDAANTIHKIFGELLKETGKDSRGTCLYAILIPEDGLDFYSRCFQYVKREKYIGFGDLIPVHSVFTCSETEISQITWSDLYDYYQP